MVINNSDIVNKLTFYIIFSNINFPPSLVKKYQLVLSKIMKTSLYTRNFKGLFHPLNPFFRR